MGCCFSKKRRKHPAGAAVFTRRCKPEDRDPPPPPSPEEEKVKEVLSETPNSKVRAETKRVANVVAVEEKVKEVLSETPNSKVRAETKPVANVVAVEEQEVEKAKATSAAEAAVNDLGSCVSLATDDRSEAASESSVATSAVGPEWSPGKPARKHPVSGELGLARRDRAVTAYGVRSRSGRASPSPPPRREPRDRSVRRSPSPAAKRAPEQRRAASPVASLQQKPPFPVRPSPRRAQETPPPLSPPPQPEEDAFTVGGELSVVEASASGDGHGDGDGKESLENPLVSLECFIFL